MNDRLDLLRSAKTTTERAEQVLNGWRFIEGGWRACQIKRYDSPFAIIEVVIPVIRRGRAAHPRPLARLQRRRR